MGSKDVRLLFDYPFRIFFFLTALWAIVVIPVWLAVLFGWVSLPLAMPLLYWHQHEMVFGFLNPAIAGFILTAVCVWTNTERTHGLPLALYGAVWIAGRLSLLLGAGLPELLPILINGLFLPLVMLDVGKRVYKVRQSRQYLLVAVLAAVWVSEMGFLLHPSGTFLSTGLVAAMLLMLMVGGRITPTFSRNWLAQQGKPAQRVLTLPALEKATLLSGLLVLITLLIGHPIAVSIAASIAALCSFVRLFLWRGWLMKSEPLLWILHLSLLWIPIGLALLAAHQLHWVSASVWVHATGIGAISSLILGVMSRVCLGHTGRPLVLPRGLVTAFLLIQSASIIRLLTALDAVQWKMGVLVTAGLWVAAFSLFAWRYTPILLSPRQA